LFVVLSLLIPTVGVAPTVAKTEEPPEFQAATAAPVTVDASDGKASEPQVYIVRLEDAPLPTYTGGVRGLSATSLEVTGDEKLDVDSPASQQYLKYLAGVQADFVTQAADKVGRKLDILYTYRLALNGLAVELTPEEAAMLRKMDGVVAVEPSVTRRLHTDASIQWIGAPSVWDGTATPAGISGTMGEGMIVGIIDTGINTDHPSFADVGGDGYDHTNPDPAKYPTGWCDPTDPDYDATLSCNDKLLGVYSYATSGNDPEDDNGHGSHTASTAAGNFVTATLDSLVIEMSGVAPHANIIAYDVCTDDGCDMDAILAAIDDAIADEVDVINYSIGGGPADPWATDSEDLAYLTARAAGIFVATSAGNDGPGAGTVGSPAVAPWLTAVGNSTTNRYFTTTLTMSGTTSPPDPIIGQSVSPAEYGPAPIVHAKDYGDALCEDPFPAGTFSGEIVVCDRGALALVTKVDNVKAGGAGGAVIANVDVRTLYSIWYSLPTVHIQFADANTLRAWLDSESGHMATISSSTAAYDDDLGDVMAISSSRGPNLGVIDILKPDITAPGTDIWAAYRDGEEYNIIGGTSMASPHVAGGATLLMDLFPDWTPAEIQSALMTTSKLPLASHDGSWADPFDRGAGRLDLTQAALAGFVLDESIANYQDADPTADPSGDPTTLNIASFAEDQCLQECSWTRTLRSTMDETVTWTAVISAPAAMTVTVNPPVFSLSAGPTGTQVITVTADVSAMPVDEWTFADITLVPDSADTVNQHFPLAVIPTLGELPSEVVIETRRDAGSRLLEDITSIEITDLTTEVFGLVQGTFYDFALLEDPTNDLGAGEMYDDLSQIYYTTFNVPTDTIRVIAEIVETTSPDVDMTLGVDVDGDGEPEAGEEVCQSATGGSEERCDLTAEDIAALATATGGVETYWVAVMNWKASTAGETDDITLSVGVVPNNDVGNMWVTGPSSVPEITPFNLRLYWNEPLIEAGDIWYGAFSLGTDPGNVGNLGIVPVDLYRHEDDVTKSASADLSGDDTITVTYTIEVQPNITGMDLTYYLTDTIPAGLTYVPGSVTGGAVVSGNQVTWSGLMQGTYEYQMSTNAANPDCDTGFGGYVNLEDFGVMAQSGISGDTSAWTAFSDLDFIFYGKTYSGLGFTDDGFGIFDVSSNYAGTPWINQNLPDPDFPNNLLAAFWKDMEIVYDETTNKGVSLATSGSTALIEYDDVIPYDGTGSEHYDFEMIVDSTTGNIAFAYDNIVGSVATTTIGIENALGTEALQYAYNDLTPSTLYDDLVICFDYVGPTDPHVITYQATVDDVQALEEGATYTNTVTHITDDPGAMLATTSNTFGITKIYLPLVFRNY
jgi:uncharacterized repeat protein (TIGR01451 family)